MSYEPESTEMVAASGADDPDEKAKSDNVEALEDGPIAELEHGHEEDNDDHDVDEGDTKLLQDQVPEESLQRSSSGIIPTPMNKAWMFSKYISFGWLNDLLSIGAKRPLIESDLYGLPQSNQTEVLAEKLINCWDEEVRKKKSINRRPSLLTALIKTFGKSYAALGILALFSDGFRILQPILLGYLVTYFAEGSDMSARDAYLYALGVGICGVLILLFNVPFSFMRNVYGLRIRAACTALVYRKVLSLSKTALASTTTGHIVNLVSADTQKFEWTTPFLHYLVLAPLEVVAAAILLWFQIGPAAMAGIGLLVCLAPMQMKMGNFLMALRTKAIIWMDERVKIMNEIISGMRVIKMYTWEESFSNWVGFLRRKELKWFLRMAFIQGGFASFFFSSVGLINFATFITYVMTGEILTAAKVFTCVSLFNSVRVVTALFFPFAITLVNESRVSIRRIEEALLLDEMQSEGLEKSKLRPKPEDCGVFVKNATAIWTKELSIPTLDNLSFEVLPGHLLGVIGAVGSGKSSLLMSILGELPLQSGNIRIQGHVAYVSQQAWVYNSSLRHNILFGKEYDETRYNDVIKACALERDIELLPEGDMTLVGERGVSLSGGQRARINLARAVYSDGDVYLLDDPLSAVDANVGRHLFQECICGYLKDKARILVTHQLQFLKDADEILVLQQGQCIDKGSYQELSNTDNEFLSHLVEEEEAGEDDSGTESDVDQEGHLVRRFGRQISRQISAEGAVRKRAGNLLESCMSVMSAATTMTVYEDNILPEETKQEGAVTKKTYLAYLRSFHNLGTGVFIIFFFAFCQAVLIIGDLWLAECDKRTALKGRDMAAHRTAKIYPEKYTSARANKEELYALALEKSNSSTNDTAPIRPDLDYFLGIYAVLVFGLLILCLLCNMLYYTFTIVSSRKLHAKMLQSTMKTTMYFFDNNSIGRILNRFSKDMGIIDDMMPWMLCDVLQTGFTCVGILCLVGASNPVTLVVVLPVLVVFLYMRNYFMKSSREIKRIEGINRSPLFGHFSTTLLGLDTIRAYRVESTFTDQFYEYHDSHSRAWFAYISAQAWLTCRLQALCVFFLLFVAFISPAIKGVIGLSAGTVGLTLTYSIMLTGVFQPFVEESAEVENIMTSVERVVEYCNLPPEGEDETEVKPPESWPDKGRIMFDNMSFAYHRSLPNVLHHIRCVVQPTEKIGVVGRTGAGKSSLLSTLFRLAEPKGVIDIDGVNISQLGLKDLRSKLSIIPQDPVLFSGTMRKNLDPFGEHTDAELWRVLEEVQLKQPVQDLPKKLDGEIAEAGSNFSVGQRQLVCLARAILRHSRILVIDEATANVDPRTDALIQETIREKFKECTVLTIAHRLHTIMDSDRVMVLDAGRLKEFDIPYQLLKQPRSIFSELVAQTGTTEARRLFDIAQQTYQKKLGVVNEEGENEESEREGKAKGESEPDKESGVENGQDEIGNDGAEELDGKTAVLNDDDNEGEDIIAGMEDTQKGDVEGDDTCGVTGAHKGDDDKGDVADTDEKERDSDDEDDDFQADATEVLIKVSENDRPPSESQQPKI